jgi:hypothetical protein
MNTPIIYNFHELNFKIENQIFLLKIMPVLKKARSEKSATNYVKKEICKITKLTLLGFDCNTPTRMIFLKAMISAFFKKSKIEDQNIGSKKSGFLYFQKLRKKSKEKNGTDYSLKIYHTKKDIVIAEKIYSVGEMEVMQTAINYAYKYLQPQYLPAATQILPD